MDKNFSISSIDFGNIVQRSIKIAIIIVLMYIIIKIGSWLINSFVRKKKSLKFSLNEKKAKTLAAVLKSILRYSVYFFGIVGILTELFGTISLTFASIGGVAIGFGSQSIIKDILNGFFILFEDQFSVGDFVDIEGKSGVIESIELRVTKIRDYNGDLHIIPNGLITKVTNHSRGSMRILIDIDVNYKENVDKTIGVISEACSDFAKNNMDLVEEPKVLGVVNIKDHIYTVRVVGRAKSMKQWDCENQLRVYIKKAIDSNEIKLFKEAQYGQGI